MAKVQAYVSDEIVYKINKIVERRRAEGAKSTDVSFSSISTMLLELGLRVHEAQMERKESTVAKILGIESLSPHVSGNPKFEYANMVEDIRDKVSSEMERFFPENDEE